MVPFGPCVKSIAGVDVMPTSGPIWPQLLSELETVSPLGIIDFGVHSSVPESASKAYTVSFSVTTYKTLCVPPAMDTAGTYKGWASTLPSSARLKSSPKLVEFTLAGDRSVSSRFCPVRAASLCQVNTPWARKPETRNIPAKQTNAPVLNSFRAELQPFLMGFIILDTNSSIAYGSGSTH